MKSFTFVELPASGFSEVGDGGVLTGQHSASVEATMKRSESSFCVLLICELCVDISYHMISQVFTNLHILYLPELRQLPKYLLVEFIEILLKLRLIDRSDIPTDRSYGTHWI